MAQEISGAGITCQFRLIGINTFNSIIPPSYLVEYDNLRTDADLVCKDIGIKTIKSSIKLDGGNVVRSSDSVIITDRVYRENPIWDKASLVKELERLLGVEVIVIPTVPYDDLGHADGMVRFHNSRTVLVNNYGEYESKSFKEKLYGTLASRGLNIIQIPYYPDNERKGNSILSATGIYINYLQVGSKIILPQFGNRDQDQEAFVLFERLFGCNVIPIDVSEIAEEGGVLNCISWTTFGKQLEPYKHIKADPNAELMFEHVMDKVSFRLMLDEYKDIESAFNRVWNENNGEFLGDGEIKHEVYKVLNYTFRQPFMPQYIVDGVVDELLNYMTQIGQYNCDFNLN